MNSNKKVDAYIKRVNQFKRPAVEEIRRIIHETLPGFDEQYKWNVPFYPPICYINADVDHVKLGLLWGRFLEDKEHVLEGEGKTVKFLRINSKSDINQSQIAGFLRDSVRKYEEYKIMKKPRRKRK